MYSDYGKERLNTFAPLFKQKDSITDGSPWLLDPDSIRFKLGTTLGDLKLPYHLGIEDEECIQLAIEELLQLYKERHETDKPDKSKPNVQSQTLKVFSVKASAEKVKIELGHRTYRLDIFRSGSIEEKLALNIITTAPLIDCSMLKVWLSPEGKGKALFDWCSELLEKSLTEEAMNEEGEMTAYLALLSMIKAIRKKKECIKEFRVKRISYELLDIATGTTLYLLMKVALDEIFIRLTTEKSIFCSPKTETILKTALIQQDFMLISPIHYSTSINQYYIDDIVIDTIKPHVPELEDWPEDPEKLVKSASQKASRNTKSMNIIESHYYNVILRENVIEYLMAYDVPGSKDNGFLQELYMYDRQSHMRDAKSMEILLTNINALKERFTNDILRSERISAITEIVQEMASMNAGKRKTSKGSKIKTFFSEILQEIIWPSIWTLSPASR